MGPPNAVFSRISFVQPNDGWLCAERFKVVEAEMSDVTEERLPDNLPSEPRALESVKGDLAIGDIKVTHCVEKHPSTCSYLLRPRQDNKEDAKESAKKGETSEGKRVLKSKPTVSMQMRRASRLAHRTKAQNTQASENSSQQAISSYFKPLAGPRPKVPDDKAILKQLVDRRKTKMRHLSGSDLEDSGERESPVPEKHAASASARQEARISAAQACKPEGSSMGSSPLVQSSWNYQDRLRPLKESSKSMTLPHQSTKKGKSYDRWLPSCSDSISSRCKENKARPERGESDEWDAISHSCKMEKELTSKSSQSWKEKESAQDGSRHCDKQDCPPSKVRKEEKSSSSKGKCKYRDRDKKLKPAGPKMVNIKQLLTKCRISNSENCDEGVLEKNKQDKPYLQSLDSTQLVDVRPVQHTSKSDSGMKKGSLYDFRRKKEALHSPATEDGEQSSDVLETAVQRLPERGVCKLAAVEKPAASNASLNEKVPKFPKAKASSCDSASPKKQDDKHKMRDVHHVHVLSNTGPSSATRSSRGHDDGNIPKVVEQTVPCDTTSSMDEEIRSVRCVGDLEQEHICYLFERILPTLEKIITREEPSWRLKVYVRGGPQKRALTHQVFIHKFSSEQIDLVIKLFVEEFGGRRRFNGDIINQVFIPEFLIRVFMANQGTTYEESEMLMRN